MKFITVGTYRKLRAAPVTFSKLIETMTHLGTEQRPSSLIRYFTMLQFKTKDRKLGKSKFLIPGESIIVLTHGIHHRLRYVVRYIRS